MINQIQKELEKWASIKRASVKLLFNKKQLNKDVKLGLDRYPLEYKQSISLRNLPDKTWMFIAIDGRRNYNLKLNFTRKK